jgi:hypothetical protein
MGQTCEVSGTLSRDDVRLLGAVAADRFGGKLKEGTVEIRIFREGDIDSTFFNPTSYDIDGNRILLHDLFDGNPLGNEEFWVESRHELPHLFWRLRGTEVLELFSNQTKLSGQTIRE